MTTPRTESASVTPWTARAARVVAGIAQEGQGDDGEVILADGPSQPGVSTGGGPAQPGVDPPPAQPGVSAGPGAAPPNYAVPGTGGAAVAPAPGEGTAPGVVAPQAPSSTAPAPAAAPPAAPAPAAPAAPAAAAPAPAAPSAPATVTRESAPRTHDAAQQQSQLIASVLPQLLESGLMMLTMLPQLTGSQGGSGGWSSSGLSPQAQRSLQVLELLKQAYGDGTPGGPGTGGLVTGPGSGDTSGSSTAQGLSVAQLYQSTQATAFENLDSQLANYLTYIAGAHGVDQNTLKQVIQKVDSDLRQLGTTAYTAQGQQQVHDILAAAVEKAQTLVAGSAVTADQTAAAIDLLTGQYLYNIHGESYPGPSGSTGSAVQSGSGGNVAGRTAARTAISEIGKPYVWGAQGPGSFDCSGLTWYAARSAGVNIPRTAAEQYQQLPKVSAGDIQPGDLIFPADEFNGGAPKHVIMYIGNGKCVSAPYPGAHVHVIPLPSSYAASRWD